MKSLATLIFLCTSYTKFTNGCLVSYDELTELNASCYPKDTCMEPRIDDSPGNHETYTCSCNILCSRLGTCCLDSDYNNIKPEVQATCRRVKLFSRHTSFYMIDRCPYDDNDNLIWGNLCQEEWNGEDDVMKIAPVTSVSTSMTYKNYFCFRCHETTDDFFFWNIRLDSYLTFDIKPEMKRETLTYDNDQKSWTVKIQNSDIPIAVELTFEIPSQIRDLPIHCETNVISHCSHEWSDDTIREKCNSYTAVIYIVENRYYFTKYRNVHCALCNFESLDKLKCERSRGYGGGYGHAGGAGYGHGGGAGYGHGGGGGAGYGYGKPVFSFTHLMDINKSGGDKVGKIQKCDFVWDPYAEKCRELKCALPDYVVKDGKCVPP